MWVAHQWITGDRRVKTMIKRYPIITTILFAALLAALNAQATEDFNSSTNPASIGKAVPSMICSYLK